MKRNMSNLDRIIRAIFAALFAYLYFGGIVTGTFGINLVVFGVILLVTAIVGSCPLYTLLQTGIFKG